MLAQSTVIPLERHSYRLDAPLAGSAYGLVWRADQLPTGPQVALKFVNQAQMARALEGDRQRWIDGARQEAALLRQLAPWDGRHVVRLCDSGELAGLPVLALELLEGDLGGWMARRRAAGQPGDVARALEWTAQLNQALARIHQYGWRHLDVKPSNLLLCDQGRRLKLGDFGTARADSAAHHYSGTPRWQAPEQVFARADGRYRTSARSDYFNMGALLFYVATGGAGLRFASANAGDTRSLTLQDDEAARFAQCCAEQIGGAGATCALHLLRALLHRDPAQRAPHALAIGRMLADIASASVPTSVPTSVPASVPTSVPTFARRAA